MFQPLGREGEEREGSGDSPREGRWENRMAPKVIPKDGENPEAVSAFQTVPGCTACVGSSTPAPRRGWRMAPAVGMAKNGCDLQQ